MSEPDAYPWKVYGILPGGERRWLGESETKRRARSVCMRAFCVYRDIGEIVIVREDGCKNQQRNER